MYATSPEISMGQDSKAALRSESDRGFTMANVVLVLPVKLPFPVMTTPAVPICTLFWKETS